jgi:CRP/FNR family cyclic AMP-dependent transcriptional regulator
MPIPTLILGLCSALFLWWWHSRLRQAEATSSALQRSLDSLEPFREPRLVARHGGVVQLRRVGGSVPPPPAQPCSSESITQALKGIWLFSELNDKQIDMIAGITQQHWVGRGQAIVTQGESDGGDLYCVLTGYCKVTTHGSREREILINILQSGESFGEIGFLDRRHVRSATVTALADAQLLQIRGRDIDALLREAPQVALTMLSAQSRLVRHLTERAEDNAFLDVRTRLAKRLVALADNLGTQVVPRGVALKVPLTHQDLGDMIQASRNSVIECLSEWTDHGVIDSIDDRLVILNPQHLKDLAAGAA